MLTINKKLLHFTVIILAFLFCVSPLGQTSILFSDEVTHSRVIQSILDTGDYFTLNLEGGPYYNKPPFKIWLSTIIVSILGESTFTFRILDALLTVGTIYLTSLLAIKLFSTSIATLSVAILLSSRGFLVESRNLQGTQEAMLLFLITSAMFLGYKLCELLEQEEAPHFNKLIKLCVYISIIIGLGVLTKSVAGLLPLFLIGFCLILRGTLLKLLRILRGWIVVPLGIIFCIPSFYYLPLILNDPNAWNNIYHGEVKNRLFGSGYHNADKWWFYFAVLYRRERFLQFPLCWIGTLYLIISQSRFTLKFCYLSIWFFGTLIPYSILSSRVFHYISPIYIPLAISASAGVLNFYSYIFSSRSILLRISGSILVFIIAINIALGFKKTFKLINAPEQKLDIEILTRDLQEKNAEGIKTHLILYKMEDFIGTPGEQNGRFRFYLHTVKDFISLTDNIEAELNSTQKTFSSKWILAPYKLFKEVTANLQDGCTTASIHHPQGKKHFASQHEIQYETGIYKLLLIKCP